MAQSLALSLDIFFIMYVLFNIMTVSVVATYLTMKLSETWVC